MKKPFKTIVDEIDPFFTFWLLKILNIFGWGRVSQVIRGKVLRFFGFNIGEKTSISYGVMIFCRKDALSIGEGTFINQKVHFDAGSPIKIGKYCDIGYNVVFAGSKHELISNKSTNRPIVKSKPIIVGDHVWIGCNSIILAGVNIGAYSVIGAGSVVTKDVPENTFVAGIPARVIKNL